MIPPSSLHTQNIGLIGLGLMGSAMAVRLVQAGFQVHGWDRNGDRLREFGALPGCTLERDADEVFVMCQRVILSLPDSNVVREVLQGRIFTPGQIIIDTSTGDPESAAEQAAILGAGGVYYLDATVSGSSTQVANGSAVLMVGGAGAAFDQCADIFACLGERIFHAGESGAGAKMKLVTNLVLGLNRAALAEGLTFAHSLGLDAALTLQIMRGSMAASRIMDTKGEKMIHREFAPQARLSQHLKDVRLMLAAADRPLPLTEAHRALLEKAESLGYGDLDNSAIIRAYDHSTP